MKTAILTVVCLSDLASALDDCAADSAVLLQGRKQEVRTRQHKQTTRDGPGEEHYIGCFSDNRARDMGTWLGSRDNAATNTFALCARACDKEFMALQSGGECFCADSYGNGDAYRQVDDTECNRNTADYEPCASNAFNCGGHWRQAIYRRPLVAEYTDAGSLPRMWDSGEVVIGVQVPVDGVVTSVTVASDWWMKRPQDLEVLVVDSSGTATRVAEFEYPTTLDICGDNGDEACSYPDRPTSRVTIPISTGIEATHVRVHVVTARNGAGEPNGQVILSGVTATTMEYTDAGSLSRMWDSGEVPIGVEVAVNPPSVVSSVTVASDWWSKRPKDLEVYVVDGSGVATLVAEHEYPTSLDICGDNGDEACSYPDRPVSRVTIPINSGVVAARVRVHVRTARNGAGQPNGQVILAGVTVGREVTCSVEVQTSSQEHAGTGTGASVQFNVHGDWSTPRGLGAQMSFNDVVFAEDVLSGRPGAIRIIADGDDAWGYRRVSVTCGDEVWSVLDSENGEPYPHHPPATSVYWVDGNQNAPAEQVYSLL